MDRNYMAERLEHLKRGEIIRFATDPRNVDDLPPGFFYDYLVVNKVDNGRVFGIYSAFYSPIRGGHGEISFSIDQLLDRNVELPVGWTSERSTEVVEF